MHTRHLQRVVKLISLQHSITANNHPYETNPMLHKHFLKHPCNAKSLNGKFAKSTFKHSKMYAGKTMILTMHLPAETEI